jgi:hypothetical protein
MTRVPQYACAHGDAIIWRVYLSSRKTQQLVVDAYALRVIGSSTACPRATIHQHVYSSFWIYLTQCVTTHQVHMAHTRRLHARRYCVKVAHSLADPHAHKHVHISFFIAYRICIVILSCLYLVSYEAHTHTLGCIQDACVCVCR